jgi:multidrug efflux pump subunit AcrA (membrane-fusion protein)
MTHTPETAGNKRPRRRKSRWRWAWRIAVLALLAGGAYWYFSREPETAQTATTVTVRRGSLPITVLESGNFEAMESQDFKSEVQGQTKILSIVEEGYLVTQEDVDSGKALVELDSKDLVDRQTTQLLEYESTRAAFTEAKEEYDIQANQNESDIKTAELAVRFARMDFEKYLGVNAAKEILTQLGLDKVDPEPGGNPAPVLAAAPPAAPASPPDPADAPQADAGNAAEADVIPHHEPVDFSKYADSALLGDGEARQKLRKCEDDEVLAKKELMLSRTQFEGTQRLAAKDFVTTNDLENERLKVERDDIALQSSETSKDLFIKYEFLKEAEKRLSDYEEALRKLERTQKLAVSKMAQADAKRNSAEKRYNLQEMKRKEIQEQINKCKIRAKKPGLVVYGGGEDFWRGDDQIKEGAMIRERQNIIAIPDLSQMAVKVKVHEASIRMIQKAQKARITVDAYRDELLTGEIVKVGILPDAQNRWMNPDIKVYEVKLSIDGAHEWLKPGMNAQVEIFVKELRDVIYVPIQAIVPSDGEKVCFVAHGLGARERRAVEVGEFNNEFIEIKSGLAEGEEVLLRAPLIPEEADKAKQEKETKAKPKEEGKDNGPEKRPAGQAPAGSPPKKSQENPS